MRKKVVTATCSNSNADDSQRRTLLVGLSVLPFLKLRASAAVDPSKDSQGDVKPKRPGPNDAILEVSSADQPQVQNPPANSFISLLNGLGILGSGILGSLYAISHKEKRAIESNYKLAEGKLSEKEATMLSMKDDYDSRIRKEQEEKLKQINKLKQDEASLLNQLTSANETIAALNQKLENEKKIIEELKEQIVHYQSFIAQASAEKKELESKLEEKFNTVGVLQDRVNLLSLEVNDKEKNIESFRSLLSEKDSENKKLNLATAQLKKDLAIANSTIHQLQEEAHRTREEWDSKISLLDALNKKLQSLQSEKDESLRRFQDLEKAYNDLKDFSDERAAVDAKLLSEKDGQLRHLEEKVEIALNEARKSQAATNKLRKERDEISELLQREVNSMKKLKDELQNTQETLRESKNEVSKLSKELYDSKRSYAEASMIKDDLQKTKQTLTSDLEEAKMASKLLSDELDSVKHLLGRTKEELDVASRELNTLKVEHDSLKRELLQAYKKLETTVHEVTDGRKAVSTLNKELGTLRKQMQIDSEARRALEVDLDEATRSLDEMNKSALSLSKELENSNTKIASLEAEKDTLFKSLTVQKNFRKEAQENFEAAQDLIKSIQNDKETLEKISEKLEEELASAKGEILRLRRELSVEKESVDSHKPKTNEIVAGTPFSVKMAPSRRKKGGSNPGVSS